MLSHDTFSPELLHEPAEVVENEKSLLNESMAQRAARSRCKPVINTGNRGEPGGPVPKSGRQSRQPGGDASQFES
jgi:hypothetical protein